MPYPQYGPASLLVLDSVGNVMLDGGPAAVPDPPSAAWLVTDLRADLIAQMDVRDRADLDPK